MIKEFPKGVENSSLPTLLSIERLMALPWRRSELEFKQFIAMRQKFGAAQDIRTKTHRPAEKNISSGLVSSLRGCLKKSLFALFLFAASQHTFRLPLLGRFLPELATPSGVAFFLTESPPRAHRLIPTPSRKVRRHGL